VIDATQGRPPGPAALWVSFQGNRGTVTFLAELDGYGTIVGVPPIARWAKGQRFTALHRWARGQDRRALFAWVGADGIVGEVWS
jgi:hypothetical protein